MIIKDNKKLKVLAIIPARSGSKGIKNKNLANLHGKPLIYWTIKEAKKVNFIDEIIVSTDSKIIADEAKKYSIKVPFIRPKKLSSDTSNSIELILHALNWFEKNLIFYDIVILLEPTSPFRESQDIVNAVNLMISKDAQSVVGISEIKSDHPDFTYSKNKNYFIKPFFTEKPILSRRQDTKTLFFLEGSVYASYTDTLRKELTFYHNKTVGFEFSKIKSIEIDDKEDLYIAEALMNYKERNTIEE